MSSKQNILIIGGGAAGVSVAKELSKKLVPDNFSIQLVTERPYTIHYPALIRMVVTSQGKLEDLALNPYTHIFESGRAGEVIIGHVDRVEDGAAYLSDGRKLPYHWLVLATGTTWNGPLNLPHDPTATQQWLAEWRSKFSRADNIVIVGGGAVGVEMAGEIRHFHPNKRVTIVHSQDYLLNDVYPDKFRKRVVDKARANGTDVILNDRASVPQGQYSSVTTEKGVNIEADLVVPLWGGTLNTEFLRSFDPTILTNSHTVRVLPTLRVPLANGKANVFALGDIIDWKEQKMLAKVPSHASVVVANLLASVQGKAGTSQYKGFMEAIGLPFGPTGGITYLPLLWGITLGDWFTAFLKSKTLFVENAQKMMNMPKV
ncbi:hypothetical protein FRB99_002121 [Tulasnella sp. 403]|nr:hypothetical protein FRB99_002121 [Tulasnella sp. 403]